MQTLGSTSQKAGRNQIAVPDDIHLVPQQELASALSCDNTDQWLPYFNTAAIVIGYRKTRHKDWFDE